MSRLTVFLARLIGLSTILIVIAFLVRGSATIDATVADAPVMLVYAIISLAVNVAMILGHNVWSGGALPVVVTLVGWLILAKGLLLLFLNGRLEKRTFLADAPTDAFDPKTNRQSRNDRFRAEKFGFRSMARWNC